jgi:hypothetical protein
MASLVSGDRSKRTTATDPFAARARPSVSSFAPPAFADSDDSDEEESGTNTNGVGGFGYGKGGNGGGASTITSTSRRVVPSAEDKSPNANDNTNGSGLMSSGRGLAAGLKQGGPPVTSPLVKLPDDSPQRLSAHHSPKYNSNQNNTKSPETPQPTAAQAPAQFTAAYESPQPLPSPSPGGYTGWPSSSSQQQQPPQQQQLPPQQLMQQQQQQQVHSMEQSTARVPLHMAGASPSAAVSDAVVAAAVDAALQSAHREAAQAAAVARAEGRGEGLAQGLAEGRAKALQEQTTSSSTSTAVAEGAAEAAAASAREEVITLQQQLKQLQEQLAASDAKQRALSATALREKESALEEQARDMRQRHDEELRRVSTQFILVYYTITSSDVISHANSNHLFHCSFFTLLACFPWHNQVRDAHLSELKSLERRSGQEDALRALSEEFHRCVVGRGHEKDCDVIHPEKRTYRTLIASCGISIPFFFPACLLIHQICAWH